MLINQKSLIKLPVVTESGRALGQVMDFNIDTDSQSILSYQVKPPRLVEGLLKGSLEINRGQVVDITAKHLIVEDNVVKSDLSLIGQLRKAAAKQSSPEPEPVASHAGKE